MLHMMAKGVDPNKEDEKKNSKSLTLGDALEEYLESRGFLKKRTKDDYRYYIDKYAPDWKNTPLAQITKKMIASRHTHIAQNNGQYPANKVMRVVRALFNYVNAKYDSFPINPVLYLTQARAWCKEKRRRTYIKPHDLKKWWDAVYALENDTYRDFFLLMIFTGLRRGEAQKLRWADIDFKDRTFTIPDTKNGNPLTLPIGDFLLSMFTERRKRYGNYEYVFPGTGVNGHLVEPKKGMHKVINASGVQFTNHDLRRTFITIGESLEISAYALKRLINHRATDVTGGYIIVDVERLRCPVNKIEAFILEKKMKNC